MAHAGKSSAKKERVGCEEQDANKLQRRAFKLSIPVKSSANAKDWKECRKIYQTIHKISVSNCNNCNCNVIVPSDLSTEAIKIISVYAVGKICKCSKCSNEMLILHNEIYSKLFYCKVETKNTESKKSSTTVKFICFKCNEKKTNDNQLNKRKEMKYYNYTCHLCGIKCFEPKILKTKCRLCNYEGIKMCKPCQAKYISYDIVCGKPNHRKQFTGNHMFMAAIFNDSKATSTSNGSFKGHNKQRKSENFAPLMERELLTERQKKVEKRLQRSNWGNDNTTAHDYDAGF